MSADQSPQRPNHSGLDDWFEGRVIAVTGGASGIGAGLAAALAARGARVVVLDRVRYPGIGAVDSVVGDVTTIASNEALVHAAMDVHGRLDGFVGNAGVHDAGRTLLDLPPEQLHEQFTQVMDINVTGYVLGARLAVPAMLQTIDGDAGSASPAIAPSLVFTLSDASFHVSRVGAGLAYAVSKHAGLGLVRALAAQLAPRLRVNAVAPGGVVTGLEAVEAAGTARRSLFSDPSAVGEQVRGINPLGVMLRVEDVVEHYLTLLSPRSVGMTGQVLRPDGGLEVA